MVWIHHSVNHSPVLGHRGCFQFRGIMLRILYIGFCVNVRFPSSVRTITALPGWMSHFTENCQSAYTILHFLRQERSSFSLYLHPLVFSLFFFNFSHPVRYVVILISHCGFICIFRMAKMLNVFSFAYVSSEYPSQWNTCSGILFILLLNFFSLLSFCFLYFPDKSAFSGTWFPNIFSRFIACLFNL